MSIPASTIEKIRSAINTERLVDTAVRLVEVPSPTRSAGKAAQRLHDILKTDGFTVERPEANWPESPAVVCRLDSGAPGRTLQFAGHLDTVHLPFVPPRVENGNLYGSGASDMKGGIAAMVEATRALRDSGALTAGSILVSAHELHEAPWAGGEQVDALIDAGYVGDAVLLPEYCFDRLPLAGRGLATTEIVVRREGDPVHEVLGGIEAPNVLYGGAELLRRFRDLDEELKKITHPVAGRGSIFIGMAHGGEIFNQSPVEFRMEGTRRWLPGTDMEAVTKEFHRIVEETAAATGTNIEASINILRDGVELDPDSAAVAAFQAAHEAATGKPLPPGPKPFVDDGNAYGSRGGIPAITHGPNAKGAHTVNEEVPVAELERVALIYALTAIQFCAG